MTLETKKRSLWLRISGFFVGHLKKKFVAGLLILIPLGITIFILKFLFGLADGVLAPSLQKIANYIGIEGRYIPGLGMVTGLLVIYVTGIFATNLLGSQLVHAWERLLTRIPLVKSIYTSSKKVIQVFSHGGTSSFRRSVYVEFPKEGSYSIAFITNQVETRSGKSYYMVFVPTSPNPTSGYVLMLEEDRVYPTAFSVEEAMRIIMSGGMVAPDVIEAEKLQ